MPKKESGKISVLISKDLIIRLKATMDENERLHEENKQLLKEGRCLYRENEVLINRLVECENKKLTDMKYYGTYRRDSPIVGIGKREKATEDDVGEQWQTTDDRPTEVWDEEEGRYLD